jgi:ribonuclease HI
VSRFQLFSDGGGERGAVAAAAFIVDAADKSLFNGERLRVVLPLGGATNNEAEILGGLAGLTIINALKPDSHVQWFSDSEYTLKSATQYIKNWQTNGWKTSARQAVKNLGLWKIYLEVSRTLDITPSHVKGHSGHPENEECDSICTQLQGLQLSGPQIFSEGTARAKDGHIWHILDGRPLLEIARNDHPEVSQFCKWIEQHSFS